MRTLHNGTGTFQSMLDIFGCGLLESRVFTDILDLWLTIIFYKYFHFSSAYHVQLRTPSDDNSDNC